MADTLVARGLQRTKHLFNVYAGFLHLWCWCWCVDVLKMLFYVRQMRKDPEAKRAVLLLISRGMITVPEAAQLAGVSRQLIHAWCGSHRIVPTRARQAKITKAWRRALAER